MRRVDRELVVLMLVVAAASASAQAAAAEARLLVVPFENVERDGRLFWMSEGAAMLLAIDAGAIGSRRDVAATSGCSAYERLQLPPPRR